MKPRFFKIIFITVTLSLFSAVLPAAEPDSKAIDDYNFAVYLYNTGKYGLAADSYGSFLQNFPTHQKAADARFGLAQSLFHSDKFQDAAREYEKVRSDYADFPQAAELLFQLAQTYVALNRFNEAAALFDQVRTKYGTHYLADWAMARQAACLISMNKNKEAGELLKTFTAKYTDNGEASAEKSAGTKAMMQQLDKAGIKAGDSFLSLVERSVFYEALVQFNLGRFDESRKLFDHFLKRYSSSKLQEEAQFRLAQCYYRQDAFSKAADAYETVASGSGEFAASASFERGLALYKSRKLADASAAFARMAERFPQNSQAPLARLYSGTFLYEASDFKGAIALLEPIVQAGKERADEATYWLAMSLLKLGDNAKAEQTFAKAIETFPKSAIIGDMQLGLADARLAQGRFEQAAEAFQRYARDFEKTEQAPRALYSACAALHRIDKYSESDALCGSFLEKYPKNELAPQVLFLSGENRFLQKRYDKASERYKDYLQKGDTAPDRLARAHYRMAWVNHYAKHNDDALAELRKIDVKAAGELIVAEMKYLEGVCLFELGKFTEAVKPLEDYLQAADHSRFGDDALLKSAVAQMKLGRKAQAATVLERFIAEYPKSELLIQVQYQLAECYYDQKAYSKAIEKYTLVADREAGDELTPYALFGIGLCWYDQDKWDEAIKAFTRMADKFPKSDLTPQTLYRKARSLIKLKKWAEAEQVARSLIATFPRHELARAAQIAAGTCLQEQQKWAEAAVAFKAAVEDYPAGNDQSRILYEQAWSWRQADKEPESLSAFRQLAEKYSSDPLAADAYFYLAEAKYKAKADAQESPKQRDQRLAEANGLYEKVLTTAKDKRLTDKALYRIGWCNWMLEQYPKAAAAFDRLAKEFPDSDLLADSIFQAGQSFAKAGQPATAIERFRTLTGNGKFSSFEFLSDAYLGLADCLIILDKHSDAVEPLETVLQKSKEDRVITQANFLLGKVRFNLNKYDDAIACFQEVTKRTKSATGAEAQFYIGQSLQAKNDFKAAVIAYMRLEALFREQREWIAAGIYESAKCHEALGDKDQAKKNFSTIVNDYKNTRWAKPAAERLGSK